MANRNNREHIKRGPQISPTVKRIIAVESLRDPELPREYLARQLKEKIESLDFVSPTEETLKRRISEARQHRSQLISPYWNLGLQFDEKFKIPPEAIPKVLEIQRYLKENEGFQEYTKLPITVVYWIGQLYKTVDPPILLFFSALAYSLYMHVMASTDKKYKNKETINYSNIDTSELDKLLIAEDYETLIDIAIGLRYVLGTNKTEDIRDHLPEILEKAKGLLGEYIKEVDKK
jgi:hypothetical protein